MPRGKNNASPPAAEAHIENQIITHTIESNYMPYVMSVIISRAIPEIDGFKPSHRKLLYTMYKMGLLSPSAPRTKSANIVGQTMKLNPHGDGAIYETLVRLTKGNEALLHPFIDSKGSFGKQYSRDMAYAASRYTECKLDSFCTEVFNGIDRGAVDFTDNYDNTMLEPVLLPTAFPNVLVSPNQGVAVGMASQICSFNLNEVCDTTIELLKNPELDINEITQILKAPDFPTGGQIIYNAAAIKEIYASGKGSVTVRSRYTYDKNNNCIDIFQIPYTATVEAIIDKISTLVKEGKIKEISDVRDETDLGGLKLTIDLKRGTDPEKIMAKLFRSTPLEDNFPCNFNILIKGSPRQLGVKEILTEWINFRVDCVKRELTFDRDKKQEKLHLLYGLQKILLDIDKAIRIIRHTERESEVVPNLMEGFGIDEIQAEYIAEIRLRHLNAEYILNRTDEIGSLESDIADITDTLNSEKRLKNVIIKQLENIKKKYGKPRMSLILYDDSLPEADDINKIENYPVYIVMTNEGYFKKIAKQPRKTSADEHKLKEGDKIIFEADANNAEEVLFFTDKGQVYKARLHEFDDNKPSALGDYIPAKLDFAADERVISTISCGDYRGYAVIFFENGKAVQIPLSLYMTKTNRKKLSPAYSTVSPAKAIFAVHTDTDFLLLSRGGNGIVVNSSLIPEKSTRTAAGNIIMLFKKGDMLNEVIINPQIRYENLAKYKKTKVPSRGAPFTPVDLEKNQVILELE